MQLVRQLLWQGKNKWQIAGAALGAFLGLFLLLAALQLYFDLQTMISGNGTDGQYVLINKKVNLMNTLGASATFTEEEVEELEQQAFIESVGRFSSNRFRVGASSSMLGFYTELFFESVPDEFIDVNVGNWDWKEGQSEVPIIMSRDYLALYNFGFAPSQGLPQFTPSTIRRVSVDITVRGNGLRKVYQGRIVGFSDRINSILVPQSFMDWNNQRFGESNGKASSRLILQTTNPYAQEFRDFLESKSYEVSSGKLIGGQLTTVLRIVIGTIAFIGAVIMLLSVLVFILTFQLIISQSAADVRLLLQLGYKPDQIGKVLRKALLLLFGSILMLTLIALLIEHQVFSGWLNAQGFALSAGIHPLVWGFAIGFSVLFIFINFQNVKRSIQKLQ